MINYYDKDSNIITFNKFVDLLDDEDYKRVNITAKDGYIVSTIWLGISQSLFVNEKPTIFETMIFKNNEDLEDVYQQRYSTKEEALIGHDATVENLKKLVENETRNPDTKKE